jgi:glyoxylase I family protein
MPTALGLHHIAIQAQDIERLARFYREAFGLAEMKRWFEPDGTLRSIWLACGEGFLAIERAAAGAKPSELPFRHGVPGLHLFALRIRMDDRERIEKRLAELRVSVEHRTRWSLFVRDAEGNRIGLTHYPDEAESP